MTMLRPSGMNPRKRFEGRKFEELKDSIAAKGVLQPILVRPVDGYFEIVAGERRYRALKAVSEGLGKNLSEVLMPAMVRPLSDDEAFDVMTIENLQREDLSEREEAEAFKAFIDRHGQDAIEELAGRTGIHPGYIRRRAAVLDLPQKVLQAWEDGKLRYGHLEQLLRVKEDKKLQKDLMRKAVDYDWSVKDIRREIDRSAPCLSKALFDTAKAGCPKCFHNTDRQKRLFDLDAGETKCLKPACFQRNQNNWLLAHWKESPIGKKYKTNGFQLEDNGLNYERFESCNGLAKPVAQCKKCENFVSIIDSSGELRYRSAGQCCADPACYKKLAATTKEEKAKPDMSAGGDGGGIVPEASGPRVSWHGEYFREAFFEQRLPEQWRQLDYEFKEGCYNEKLIRLAVFGLVKENRELRPVISEKLGLENQVYGAYDTEIFQALATKGIAKLYDLLSELLIRQIMQREYTATARRLVAEHIGIDLASEWAITAEYMEKKTVAEIKDFGEKLGIFADEKFKGFCFEKLLLKRGKLPTKKGDLVRAILESGVDLVGKVPDEILAQ